MKGKREWAKKEKRIRKKWNAKSNIYPMPSNLLLLLFSLIFVSSSFFFIFSSIACGAHSFISSMYTYIYIFYICGGTLEWMKIEITSDVGLRLANTISGKNRYVLSSYVSKIYQLVLIASIRLLLDEFTD